MNEEFVSKRYFDKKNMTAFNVVLEKTELHRDLYERAVESLDYGLDGFRLVSNAAYAMAGGVSGNTVITTMVKMTPELDAFLRLFIPATEHDTEAPNEEPIKTDPRNESALLDFYATIIGWSPSRTKPDFLYINVTGAAEYTTNILRKQIGDGRGIAVLRNKYVFSAGTLAYVSDFHDGRVVFGIKHAPITILSAAKPKSFKAHIYVYPFALDQGDR